MKKYYLETNALRSIGSKIKDNKELLDNSFTSIFSLFEIVKGITKKKDSDRRLSVLNNILNTNLDMIDKMPFEMILNSLNIEPVEPRANEAFELLKEVASSKSFEDLLLILRKYKNIIFSYEESDNFFKNKMDIQNSIPKPKPKTIEIDFNDSFSLDDNEENRYIPKDNWHPSDVIIDMIKNECIINTYKNISSYFNVPFVENDELVQRYNGSLDLYYLAEYMYNLKKTSLREMSKKNDLMDVLHVMYLIDRDTIMVSDDKIFEFIIPEKNLMKISKYKELINDYQS